MPILETSATKPFLSLKIVDNKIVFKTISDSIVTPHIEAIQATDSNAKLYKIKTETAQLNIQISQQNCINVISGDTFPCSVSVEYKKNSTTIFEKVNSHGHYTTNYRLHDI